MSPEPAPILQSRNLGKEVVGPAGVIVILRDINLSVFHGDSIAITGASGSGKSTLLGLLAGLDKPSRGNISLCGHEISFLDENQRALIRRGKVGFVFQAFHLLNNLSALENVSLPLEIGGDSSLRRNDIQARALDALHRVGLSHRLQHYPGVLSGGEQQRVAIARAFVCQPQLLFADEPTGNLDHQTGSEIIDLLFQLNHEFKTTLILVSHEEKLANRCRECFPFKGQSTWPGFFYGSAPPGPG